MSEQNLPDGVVMATIRVPVFIGKLTGYDGGHGHVDLRLGRVPAVACQRVLLAHKGQVEAAGGRTPSRSDAVRRVFQLLAHEIVLLEVEAEQKAKQHAAETVERAAGGGGGGGGC
ncbi:MAG TPA: hypothetical protein VMX97_10000 [Hyphomicrobiaceae bacterium]|nr:hypothetical protein [Hyphomicrobiaceae bacterium]